MAVYGRVDSGGGVGRCGLARAEARLGERAYPSGEKAQEDRGLSSPISLLLMARFFTSSRVPLISSSCTVEPGAVGVGIERWVLLVARKYAYGTRRIAV